MKIIAIDLVDLFNYSFCKIVTEFFHESRVREAVQSITIDMLEYEIISHLNSLDDRGFKKNAKVVIVDPGSVVSNLSIQHEKLEPVLGLQGNSLMIDAIARSHFDEVLDTIIPTGIDIEALRVKLIDDTKHLNHISFANIGTDFISSVHLLRDVSPIDVDIYTMQEIFGKTWAGTVIINAYDFYYNLYGTHIVCSMTPAVKRILNTNADQAICAVLN